jgi:hypothetical protein
MAVLLQFSPFTQRTARTYTDESLLRTDSNNPTSGKKLMWLSVLRKSDIKNVTISKNFNSAPHSLHCGGLQGVRFAPMNSANYKTVRFAIDCLPRYGIKG